MSAIHLTAPTYAVSAPCLSLVAAWPRRQGAETAVTGRVGFLPPT
jgi:hypothetical protein